MKSFQSGFGLWVKLFEIYSAMQPDRAFLVVTESGAEEVTGHPSEEGFFWF
jgi:hypothetical protein